MKRKIFYGTLIVMIIILVVIGTYIYNLFTSFEQGVSDSFEATDRDRSELRLDDIDPTMDSFTVLILGIDESATRKEQEKLETEDFRTDTMILATFDKEQDEVKLTSIPRDTLTYFPEENYFDKITHAHREGGPEASMRAVESLLNVPVDHYVRVNMTAVVDIVDALGGVEFDVPFDMEEPNQTDRGEEIVLEEGEQVLNGEEALAVVRSRSVDTDLGRGQRQLKLVEKILSKAKSTGALSKIDDLIEVVADNTKHDMESKTIRSLAAYYSFNDIEFNTTQVRGDDFWNPGNGAYFYWANEEHLFTISKTLRDVLDMDAPDPYDLINIRLSDHIVPYQFVDDYYLNEFEPEGEPYFMQEGYESRFGNGFNIQEDNPEDSIEGEENPEEATGEEATGEQPIQEEATGEMPGEQTTEEDNYWPPEDGNGSEGIQEESTEQFNYEENTEEYYDNGTGSAEFDRAQNEY
ncbi:LCP family protein [Salinicoccus roseus]|uniref:LCP family protein n=1 Tax=Salinicoccus roseus TaxID=45670 RepID=UPI0022FFCD29|nr:LCP family protein [Salinicoccus roseus]